MRLSVLGAFGGALICGVVLAACGGGGGSGHASGAIPAATSGSSNSGNETKILVTIRSGKAHAKVNAHAKVGGRAAKRPAYVSTNAEGLQISVTSGSTTQTVYADISNSSVLCTTSGNVRTCALSVPTLGAQETFIALEVDQTPTGEGANGYGTGFAGPPNGPNILAAINQSENLSSQLGGPITVGLTLGPVVSFFYDCSSYWTPPTPLPQTYTANFGDDTSGFNNSGGYTAGGRIVVTAGVAATGTIIANFCDASGGYEDYATSTAPFVDVNTSPVPLTVTSSVSQVTVAPIINNGTPPPSTAYSTTASIPGDAYYWDNLYLVVAVNVSSSYPSTSASTITLNNNLTAVNPFTGETVNQLSPTGGSMPYYVAAIAASSYSFPSVAASGTATVTGTDEGARSGMDAESAYGAGDEDCNNGSGAPLATVAPSSSISTSTWQESFTISAGATAGTCTFYLYDTKAGTVTQPISVTVE
ncbi:MAG TPA: hypothetical protein VMD47_02840 [Candidatus Acidoferrales bacterium]|nr:hypothetical protein [Candidatus Acidoferrales bacterium]